jgi:hypothetical protein
MQLYLRCTGRFRMYLRPAGCTFAPAACTFACTFAAQGCPFACPFALALIEAEWIRSSSARMASSLRASAVPLSLVRSLPSRRCRSQPKVAAAATSTWRVANSCTHRSQRCSSMCVCSFRCVKGCCSASCLASVRQARRKNRRRRTT